MATLDVDVAVIGGGPAGAAAALTLLRYSALRVALVERSSYEDWRPGEALSPAVMPLLRYLDAGHLLETHGHLASHGTAAAWGTPGLISRDFLFTGQGPGWHLDRAVFDRALGGLVAERGGTVLLAATIVQATFSADRWRLEVRRDPEMRPQTVTAGFVIDATGRRAAFARRLGARRTVHDRLFAVAGLCRFAGAPPRNTFTIVESGPLGWWYSARLPDGRMVVALMTDADLVRERHLQTSSTWWTLLQTTKHTRARLAGAVIDQPPVICPAFSQILRPIAADRWVAAGDAAVGFDPLSAMGIGYAITSGIHAARAVHDALTAGGTLLSAYGGGVERHYARYLARQRAYYMMERRWPDAPFWTRRREPFSLLCSSKPHESRTDGQNSARRPATGK
ncbi:MAG TPA: tryptophan 7-halogenase [Vicinamibacterales bacterium]|nr:tryptophan 7-halogenase [Vicinamibacterales bacterium]